MVEIPPEVRAKLEEPNFWHLATVGPSGRPTVSPMWVHVEGDHVLLNTAIGRLKEQNIRTNPRVALSLSYPDNPYSRIEIRGRVVEAIEGQPADDSIDALARKYIGQDYPFRAPDERRILYRVEPTKIVHHTA